MKSRSLLLATLAVVLAACGSKATKPELKPAPLPVFQPAATIGVLWKDSTSDLGESMLEPAFNGGSVYAAGRKGDLARFDAAGRTVWKIRTEPRLSGGVATDDSRVVVASSDGNLMAFGTADGKPLWKIALGGEVLAAPLLHGDVVVVRIGDNQLAAYSLADGSRKWVYLRAQAPLALRSHAGLAAAGDMLFAGFPGGKLVALSISAGVQRWEATIAPPKGSNEIERLTDIVGVPVIVSNMVCVAAFQGRVGCVDGNSGNLRWGRDIPSSVGIAAEGGFVYVTDSGDAIHALDASTGASAWKQDKLSLRRVGRPSVVGDALVVADGMGYVHAISRKDGSFIANYRVDSSGVRAPLLPLPNNAFAAQAADGDVYALSLRR